MQKFNPENAVQVGHALTGFGVNILVSRIDQTVQFLSVVFDFTVLSNSGDYALLQSGDQYFQVHADHTYDKNLLPSLLPECGPRGGGVELRLFNINPDEAERRARFGGYTVLMATADKPHGLRECFLLDPDGYCWCPSVGI